ncbi:MAG: hypothetical protein ABI690_05760 [Chloroflexota bacterium]
MKFDLVPIIVVAGYLAFVVVWITQFNKRIEPWLRARIGWMLHVEIVRRQHFRNISWEAAGDAPRGTGCLISLWEFVVTFVVGAGMVFFALLVMGLIMFAIYG